MNKPSQQQVIDAYKKLPPPVQEFLADPDQLAAVLTGIKATYNLHIDVLGQVNESIGHLLLGLVGPSDFKDALKTAGIAENTINGIVDEINKKVFVPLREQMRKGMTATQSAVPTQSAPPPASAPPTGPQSHFHLQNKIAPPPRPAGAPVARPALREALASVMDSSKLLEDHEEPHIELGKKSVSPAPPSPVPARPAAPPPQNLPGHMPPITVPQSPKPTAPAALVAPRIIPPGGRASPVSGAAIGIPPAPPVPPAPPKPEIPKSYSVDPYREPIDEPEE